jgi:hypothetical protein
VEICASYPTLLPSALFKVRLSDIADLESYVTMHHVYSSQVDYLSEKPVNAINFIVALWHGQVTSVVLTHPGS